MVIVYVFSYLVLGYFNLAITKPKAEEKSNIYVTQEKYKQVYTKNFHFLLKG